MTAKDAYIHVPDLIDEMMIDLRIGECEFVREFYISPNRECEDGPGLRFTYFEDDLPDLCRNVALLIEKGLVTVVDPNLYRMTEDFAKELLDGWPQQRWPQWLDEVTLVHPVLS
ncbi:MAG: hypothetical protein ACKVP0_01865 [Pirellulaceae bacterium]